MDSACFDCVSMEEVGDILIARFLDASFLPEHLEVVELAHALPQEGENVVALGKPEI